MLTAVQVSVIPCSNEFHRFSLLTLWKSIFYYYYMYNFAISVEAPFLLGWGGVNSSCSTFSPCRLLFCILWSCSFLFVFFCKLSHSFRSLYHSYRTSLSDVSFLDGLTRNEQSTPGEAKLLMYITGKILAQMKLLGIHWHLRAEVSPRAVTLPTLFFLPFFIYSTSKFGSWDFNAESYWFSILC